MKKGRAVVIPAIPWLTEHPDAIRRLGKQTVESIIEIGRRLIDCRGNHLEHGEWGPWLEREFGWSDSGEFVALKTHLGEDVPYLLPKGKSTFTRQTTESISWAGVDAPANT